MSYADSFGSYSTSSALVTPRADWLGNFDAISVRDAKSQAIVKDTLGYEPYLVLDPCLDFEIEPEEREPISWDRHYAAVYGHNFSAEFIQNIRRWAKRRCRQLVSIGYPNEWADEQWIDADPYLLESFGTPLNYFEK